MVLMKLAGTEGWLCINLSLYEIYEDNYFNLLDSINGTDRFLELKHTFPMGYGITPDEALESFDIEVSRFNKDIVNYILYL